MKLSFLPSHFPLNCINKARNVEGTRIHVLDAVCSIPNIFHHCFILCMSPAIKGSTGINWAVTFCDASRGWRKQLISVNAHIALFTAAFTHVKGGISAVSVVHHSSYMHHVAITLNIQYTQFLFAWNSKTSSQLPRDNSAASAPAKTAVAQQFFPPHQRSLCFPCMPTLHF